MFASLLNTVFAYDPVGLGLPYNHLIFNDSLEPLVEVALQILIVALDHDTSNPNEPDYVSTMKEIFGCNFNCLHICLLSFVCFFSYPHQTIYS